MPSRTKRIATGALALSLSLSMSTIGSVQAQSPLPGAGESVDSQYIPPQVYSPPSSSAAQAGSGVMTGQVTHDIIPAQKLLSEGKYSEAEESFRELLVKDPQDLAATVGLGISLAKQFKLDGAEEMFDRVLLQNPHNALAYAGKAEVILNRLQSSSMTIRKNRESYLKQAEIYAKQAASLAPASAESHFALGRVYQEQGHLDSAAGELRTATQLDPHHSYAFSALGKIYLSQKATPQAVDAFKRAIELNSGNSGAHYGLGSAYLAQGDVDQAIQELNTSLYQFPNSWPVRMELGQAYQQQGNTVAALKEYRQSIMIKPENATPYLKIAEIRESKGDLELALAELHSGLTQMPYNLDLRQHIAEICLKLEKADQAITEYQTILKMGPNDTTAIKGLSKALCLKAQKQTASALLASNDYEQAMKSIDEAVKLTPNDMELRLAKAKLMSLAGTKPDISEIGEPQNDGERLAKAEALMAQGDFQKASADLTQVISNLQDARQAFAVGDVAILIKDLDNAEAAYKKAQAFSGSPKRVERGLTQIAKLRSDAQENVKVGDELNKKKQFDGAVDRFRKALSQNPKLAEARYGLALALEKSKKPTSAELAEAAAQYKNYLVLDAALPQKDKEKFEKLIEKLTDKAAKEAQKESKRKG